MANRPWFPTIFLDKCDCCNGTYKCVNFCPHEVLEVREDEVSVVNPLECIYGCSACDDLCPKNAISFPSQKASFGLIKKKSLLHRVVCKRCGKKILTDRETEYCFDCDKLYEP